MAHFVKKLLLSVLFTTCNIVLADQKLPDLPVSSTYVAPASELEEIANEIGLVPASKEQDLIQNFAVAKKDDSPAVTGKANTTEVKPVTKKNADTWFKDEVVSVKKENTDPLKNNTTSTTVGTGDLPPIGG